MGLGGGAASGGVRRVMLCGVRGSRGAAGQRGGGAAGVRASTLAGRRQSVCVWGCPWGGVPQAPSFSLHLLEGSPQASEDIRVVLGCGEPMGSGSSAWWPESREPVQWGRQVVVDCVVVVVRVCPLCVVPRRRWERWQALVVVVGVSVVHVMVWCGPVCGGQLRWGVVVMELVEAAVVFGHQGVGVRGGGGVLMVLVVPGSLALHEWWSLCDMDLCG